MHTESTANAVNYFVTENGMEVPAISTEQMIEVDRIAMVETGPNLFQMMENAGRNLAELVLQIHSRKWEKAQVVVLAGSGGNGGGGICAARHLANRNIEVQLALARPEKLTEVTAFQRKIFQWTSGKEVPLEALGETYPDIIIDALIGYNLVNVPHGQFAAMINWANNANSQILSLDVPSGVDATTGESPGIAIQPQWTMTLALPKTGLLPEKTGDLWLADIGIPDAVYRQVGIDYVSPFGKRFRVPLNVDELPPQQA